MQTNDRCWDANRIAKREHNRLHRLVFNAIGDDVTFAIFRRQVRLGNAVHELLTNAAVGDQLFDADNGQIELLGKSRKLVTGGAISRLVEDFAQHACRLQACHPSKVDRRFGMASATQHAPFFRHERKQMPRPDKIARDTLGVGDRLDRRRTFCRSDSCACGSMVHRHGVIRT